MLKKVLGVLGDSNEKAVKKYWPVAGKIDALEPEYQRLSDTELRAKTDEFRARLQGGAELDDVLPEAFAAVREAAKRTLSQRHFEVQLIGGIVLHQGKIAEMKTGEGKTLAATLPAYLNGLTGKGVHIVTVNDYLARRDTQWMGSIYHLLGLSVACLQHETSYLYDPEAEAEASNLTNLRRVYRQEAYQADITYGTNNEFGFDYLRDNMVTDLDRCVQRELSYAIVDEVDNILIDEARTPLIISGAAQESTQLYSTFSRLVPRLQESVDYTVDEKYRAVSLTEEGISRMERALNVGNLYDPANFALTHYIENALRAKVFHQQDRDYVIRDGQVILVDEFTGRQMLGRRLADGLHQAIEAKEGLKVQQESITYATITLQNYFRLYKKLAGMTGTAATEAEEFWKIYKLDVVVVPTHEPMIRDDHGDWVFRSEAGKFRTIVREIEELHRQGQPVLVGTTSIEKSEHLSDMLKRAGTPHEVLNAKQHEREAAIVAQAGRPGAVTVATNMAGRGTDIILGGNPTSLELSPEEWQRDHDQVVALGGLYIIGTERHEARRIDNQLRGRTGRQGDPGSSRFYVALDDELMRRFGGERVKGVMEWVGLDEDTPLEHVLVRKSLEAAQTKVEAHNFDIRKHLVEYDDVLNRHRDVIYEERRKILTGVDLKANILNMIQQEALALVATHLGGRDEEMWNLDAFEAELGTIFALPEHLHREALEAMDREEVEEALIQYSEQLYEQQEEAIGAEQMRILERRVMLSIIDSLWVQHLTTMSNLRSGIGLQAAGQRDPLVMYKKEGHEMFQNLLGRIQHDVAHTVYHVSVRQTDGAAQGQPQPRRVAAGSKMETAVSAVGARRTERVGAQGQKIGRNDPCPCGSGKKYKRCHGT